MPAIQDNRPDVFDDERGLEQFVIQTPVVEASSYGESVKALFLNNCDVEGVVITENGAPVGLVMRTAFFQKIGTYYGNSLYMKRPASLLMDTDILKADVNESISKISIQAMHREPNKLYDYIIVYKNNSYIGVVSIQLFLIELSKQNEAQISVLKNQQQKLLAAHNQEKLFRQSLEYQSASVRNLLDHADQGFLWFGKDLIIKNEFSYKCVTLFGQSIGSLAYIDLVSPYFKDDARTIFQMAFDSYFENNSPITDNVYLMLLPSDCVINGKNIRFEYRRIESDGQKAVMVILNDITEKINLEKAMADDQNKQRLLIKAISRQAQIKQMLQEFREIFAEGYRNYFKNDACFSDNLNELFRAVHTFKGDFAQYGFISASDRLHEFEDALLQITNRGQDAALSDVEHVMEHFDPENILQEDLNVIYEVMGTSYFDESEILTFPKTKLTEIEDKIRSAKKSLTPTFVIALIEELKRKNIKGFLEQYRDYLQYLSSRLIKNMPVYLVEGDDIAINEEQYNDFLKSTRSHFPQCHGSWN
ncbi:MAG: Hpt domain-containing protein [Muricomes sp.]